MYTMIGMPDSVRMAIAAMGANFNPDILERTRALYAPLMQPSPDVEQTLDLPYGSHERQKVDVYTKPTAEAAPVLVYAPGGGFVSGDKRSDENFYGNLGRWFARQGVVSVIANYRLAPECPYPAGGEDVREALAWTRANITRFGGDPSRVFWFGQSAGAAHAASCLFDPAIRDANHQPVGAILASGIYRMTAARKAPNSVGYYGPDESLYAARSPINHVGQSRTPLFLSLAEFDPIGLAIPTLQLAEAVAQRDGKSPRMFWQQHHNHVSTVLSFNTGDEIFGRAVLDFMRSCEAV
jgi:acetyl esterase/lipase